MLNRIGQTIHDLTSTASSSCLIIEELCIEDNHHLGAIHVSPRRATNIMATHIMYHNNETLPNTFPPPRASLRDQGMVSDFELTSSNTHTPPSIGAIGPSVDKETMPVLSKPTPMFSQSYDINDFCDPALCVTPEKNSSPRRTPLNRAFDEAMVVKPRNSQKVRFDNYVDVKHMSPDSSVGDALLVERDSPNPAADMASRTDAKDHELSYSDQDSSLSDDHIQTPTNNSHTNDYEPISVFASDFKSSKHSENASCGEAEGSMRTPYILNDKPEHVLARPEFNSTLRVGQEIQQLEDTELDVGAAVKQKLKASRTLMTAISDKVTAKVNTTSKQFQNLVSVDVCEQDLLPNTASQKVTKAKPAMKSTKLEDTVVSAPDIMEFMTPDLQKQTASLTLDGLPRPDYGPRTAQLSRAFDIYRHIRTWEGW